MPTRKPIHDIEAVKAEFLHRRACKNDLTTWCEHALAPLGQAPAAHHRLILKYLEKVEKKEITRLIINCPPGSAKSTYTSLLFPAWFMARNPNTNIIGLSYASDLAEKFSGQLRNLIDDQRNVLGYNIRENSRSRELWNTSNNCEYRCAGVTGGVTGFRSDLVLIDDVLKNFADAYSPVIRNMIWAEFEASITTRLKPGGAIVLIMTRWHPDDLAGKLLEEQPGKWTLLRLPAEAEDDDDPLGRKPGEWLWPTYQTPDMMENLRSTMAPVIWAGLYQQRPRAMSGNLFNTDCMRIVHEMPADLTVVQTVRAWDLAGTSEAQGKTADWTVGVLMHLMSNNTIVIRDVLRFRGDPAMVEQMLVATAKEDGRNVRIILPQDPGAAGKTAITFFSRALLGFRVEAVGQSGGKIERALPVVAAVNASNACMFAATWNHAFLDELGSFPGSRHDDQVDALATAFSAILSARPKTRMINTNLTSR